MMPANASVAWAVALLVALLVRFLWVVRGPWQGKWRAGLPPGPPGDLVIGHLRLFLQGSGQQVKKFIEWKKEYGEWSKEIGP